MSSNGRSIQGHEVTTPTNYDFITSTRSGNKNYLDVNPLGGSGGGGSTATSDGGYSTNAGDFTATPTVGTQDVVLAGLPFALDACSVAGGSAQLITSTGAVSDIPATNISVTGSTITFGDLSPVFAAGDVVCMSVGGPDKAYDIASDSDRIQEIDPLSQHFVTETLAAVTNGADDTYEYFVDMNGFRALGLQLILSGGSGTVTVTVEGSMQDDGTAAASVTYEDVTLDAYGAASFTASDALVDNTEYFGNFKYVRVVVVASTGAVDDADWTIFSKKLY